MKPLGHKMTKSHIPGHQQCGICHPGQKRGRAASKREAAREIQREAPTPRQLRDSANGPWTVCGVCGKDGWCGTHNDRNLDDDDDA